MRRTSSRRALKYWQVGWKSEEREFLELSHDERCQVFNIFDESSNYGVLPGAAYHTYEFVVVGGVLTLYDTLALNV